MIASKIIRFRFRRYPKDVQETEAIVRNAFQNFYLNWSTVCLVDTKHYLSLILCVSVVWILCTLYDRNCCCFHRQRVVYWVFGLKYPLYWMVLYFIVGYGDPFGNISVQFFWTLGEFYYHLEGIRERYSVRRLILTLALELWYNIFYCLNRNHLSCFQFQRIFHDGKGLS